MTAITWRLGCVFVFNLLVPIVIASGADVQDVSEYYIGALFGAFDYFVVGAVAGEFLIVEDEVFRRYAPMVFLILYNNERYDVDMLIYK